MPIFRFRAQAALDLRAKTEEAAERALAVAQATLRAAEARVASAEHALEDAMKRGADATMTATGTQELTWYRNWIVHERQVLNGCRRLEQERKADAHKATEALMAARRERKALEKLKDRAWRAHRYAEARAEQRELDMLGTVSHAARRLAAGGQE